MIRNMKQRNIYAWKALSEYTFFNPLRRQFLYFIKQSTKGKRNAIGKENLIVLVLEFILKLKAVVLHHMSWNFILKKFIS